MAPEDLTPEELAAQEAEELPAREVMTVINQPGKLFPPLAGTGGPEITPEPPTSDPLPVPPPDGVQPMPDPGETT